MSSLKGQLANVEGSVKSMKMAVVVGSVLTVACLATVFGVTMLANEVSKETKVSGGMLVNRQGENVKTEVLFEESDIFTLMRTPEGRNAMTKQTNFMFSSKFSDYETMATIEGVSVIPTGAPEDVESFYVVLTTSVGIFTAMKVGDDESQMWYAVEEA